MNDRTKERDAARKSVLVTGGYGKGEIMTGRNWRGSFAIPMTPFDDNGPHR